MHILHIINNCNRGGAGHVILELIDELRQKNVSFTVAYLDGPKNLEIEYKKMAVKTILLGKNPFLAICRVLRIIKENNISLIHTHLVHASLLGRMVGLFIKIPIITTRHYIERSRKYNIMHILEDYSSKWSDRVIAISKSVSQYLVKMNYVKYEKCITIYNPINLRLFEFDSVLPIKDRKNIICNARFIKIKGIEYLIDAFTIVGENIPEARLILIGRYNINNKVIKKIEDHKYSDRIIIKGFILRKEVIKELSKARVYVQPSLSEGLGFSAMEAMGTGCPCIFSETGGLIELANESNNAILVPAANSKLLADEIILLWNNIKKSEILSSNAKIFVCNNFDSKKIAKEYLSVYEKLI